MHVRDTNSARGHTLRIITGHTSVALHSTTHWQVVNSSVLSKAGFQCQQPPAVTRECLPIAIRANWEAHQPARGNTSTGTAPSPAVRVAQAQGVQLPPQILF